MLSLLFLCSLQSFLHHSLFPFPLFPVSFSIILSFLFPRFPISSSASSSSSWAGGVQTFHVCLLKYVLKEKKWI